MVDFLDILVFPDNPGRTLDKFDMISKGNFIEAAVCILFIVSNSKIRIDPDYLGIPGYPKNLPLEIFL